MKIPAAFLLAVCLFFSGQVRAGEPQPPAGQKATTTVDVTPDAAAALIQGKPGGALVIDVRTPDEFAAGHIPGAKNVDFFGDDFEKRIAALPADRPVIIHCAAGNRSAQAVKKINAMHKFAQIFHLKSGFNGWKAAGKPVEK